MSTRRKKGACCRSASRGIALIFVAGILTIMAAIGMAFFAITHSSMQSTVRYSDMVRADLLCRAGLAESIVRLRNQAYIKTEDPGDNWFTVDYLHGLQGKTSFLFGNGKDDDGDGIVDNEMKDGAGAAKVYMPYTRALGSSVGDSSDRFIVEVSDAASKININAGDNLAVILDNLCRVIGPPLVSANLDALQPRRWAVEADPADPMVPFYDTPFNQNDKATRYDIYYTLADKDDAVTTDPVPDEGCPNAVKYPGATARLPVTDVGGRPMRYGSSVPALSGLAMYGDGYAIAGFRARHGAFKHLDDVKSALTFVDRNGNGMLDDPLEVLEVEAKFAALRDHITINSWVDTNSVCVGKFEWVHKFADTAAGETRTYAIDRDKSWVVDDPVNDPLNERGSLRGCYVSIMNGHGAGQLRRIRTNGIDWIEVDSGFAVTPGPLSSYMIVAAEEALLMNVDGSDSPYSYLSHLDPNKPMVPVGATLLPRTKVDGTFARTVNPADKVGGVTAGVPDYSLRPLCIHRAPVNINTATDKVLAALFLGLNVQHGHPQAVGTETEVPLLRAKWKTADPHGVQPYLLRPAGLKRIPASSGKPVLNKVWGNGVGEVKPPPAVYSVAYINNYDSQNGADYLGGTGYGLMTEAHELAYRIIMARQSDKSLGYIDPTSGIPTATNTGVPRSPFRNYDDLYFRVIKPWDDQRVAAGAGKNAALSTMLMANFNSNTDILKFNPNIEWIDRWSRNFTDMEPVMVYTNEKPPADGIFQVDVPAADVITADSIPIYTAVEDPKAGGFGGGKCPALHSSQKTANVHAPLGTKCPGCNYIPGAYITRTFRYKSDEMIDKTDLNRSTTEFSFDSNGIFQITSSGQVLNTFTGQLLAERKLESLVKVYDVWRESTQQQFVMGNISKAYGDRNMSRNKTQMSCTGQLARDASGLVEPKGLTTLPEPLLPLKTKIEATVGGVVYTTGTNAFKRSDNYEAVTDCDTKAPGKSLPLDAFGNTRMNPYNPVADPAINVPEVLANRVLPARWDGQIVLSTNTSSFDPSINGDTDSFLASFDGDTDTVTCLGNGREQAKWPYSAEPDPVKPGQFRYTGKGHRYRCLQGIGLLGLLNDVMVSSDPGIPLVDGKTPFTNWADKAAVRWVYPFFGVSSALMPLGLGADPDRPMYWNNILARMGALRTDGVYLTAPGVSGNTATLKYLFSPGNTTTAPPGLCQPNQDPYYKGRRTRLNFQPDSVFGNLVTMWTKTAWHQDDNCHHEFFNPDNEYLINKCVMYSFSKLGQYKWTASNANPTISTCGNRRELNDLAAIESWSAGVGYCSFLHGGFGGIVVKTPPDPPESPAFRVQPFRWSYLAAR